MTLPNQIRDGRPGVVVVVCLCVCVCLVYGRKRDGEGGEDEKTWGASFDAVNVQIYVEGQWSTFIRSSLFPPSLPAPASSHPISFYCPNPLLPHRLFSFLPLSLILSHSVTHHHSSFSPVFFPVSHLSFLTPSLPPSVSYEGTERLLWTAAIRPIGGIGRPQKHTDRGAEWEREGWCISNIQYFISILHKSSQHFCSTQRPDNTLAIHFNNVWYCKQIEKP